MSGKRQGVFGFFEEFRFLSNFWVAEVEFEGDMYPSTEAAYQAAKCVDKGLRKKFQKKIDGSFMKQGRYVKRLGRQIEMRRDWDKIKYNVMLDVIRDKFTRHEDLKEMLLLTEDLYLEETNHWGDTYWGVCQGKGENNLGKILMKVRKEIREADDE